MSWLKWDLTNSAALFTFLAVCALMHMMAVRVLAYCIIRGERSHLARFVFIDVLLCGGVALDEERLPVHVQIGEVLQCSDHRIGFLEFAEAKALRKVKGAEIWEEDVCARKTASDSSNSQKAKPCSTSMQLRL